MPSQRRTTLENKLWQAVKRKTSAAIRADVTHRLRANTGNLWGAKASDTSIAHVLTATFRLGSSGGLLWSPANFCGGGGWWIPRRPNFAFSGSWTPRTKTKKHRSLFVVEPGKRFRRSLFSRTWLRSKCFSLFCLCSWPSESLRFWLFPATEVGRSREKTPRGTQPARHPHQGPVERILRHNQAANSPASSTLGRCAVGGKVVRGPLSPKSPGHSECAGISEIREAEDGPPARRRCRPTLAPMLPERSRSFRWAKTPTPKISFRRRWAGWSVKPAR